MISKGFPLNNSAGAGTAGHSRLQVSMRESEREGERKGEKHAQERDFLWRGYGEVNQCWVGM